MGYDLKTTQHAVSIAIRANKPEAMDKLAKGAFLALMFACEHGRADQMQRLFDGIHIAGQFAVKSWLANVNKTIDAKAIGYRSKATDKLPAGFYVGDKASRDTALAKADTIKAIPLMEKRTVDAVSLDLVTFLKKMASLVKASAKRNNLQNDGIVIGFAEAVESAANRANRAYIARTAMEEGLVQAAPTSAPTIETAPQAKRKPRKAIAKVQATETIETVEAVAA